MVPEAARRIVRALHDEETILARNSNEALTLLRRERFRLVVLGIYFDQSRMFDLVPTVQALAAKGGTPLLCVRSMPGRFSAATLKGLAQTLRSLGCHWLDLPAIPETDEGHERLRTELLHVLGRSTPKAPPPHLTVVGKSSAV